MNFSSLAQLRPDGYLLEDFDFIEEPEAAASLKIAHQTLIKYRKQGVGPAFSIVARRVIYTRGNLRTWLESGGTRATTA
jgi:hypothetical protein